MSSPRPSSNAPGLLTVVATPIGHLADASPRLKRALEEADLVLAEDTRRTRALLSHLGLSRPLLSLHAHNEARRLDGLLARLKAGQTLALVSDAGTPLVSDPGMLLVAAALRSGIRVSPVPGPSAVTAALSVSGFPADRFRFEGFLPSAAPARRRRFAALARATETIVFYEAPHRLLATLADASEAFGAAREAVLAHELTKLHETVIRAPLGVHVEQLLQADEPPRGEYVLIVSPLTELPGAEAPSEESLRGLELLAEELPPAKAAALAQRLWGIDRRTAYAILTLRSQRAP